jgi:2,3-bisphosphoglycerate-independent phosphoglycerate mutase
VLPYPLDLVEKLAISTDSRILLVVLDGVGDVAAGGMTPLAAASTPNLDELARGGSLGLSTPVAPGIAPGSGPGHLSLFGYDPIVYEVGRGVLSALGLGLDLGPDQVAARGNFATVDAAGKIVDRRAGRISTELNRTLIAALSAAIREIDGVTIDLHTEAEYRFVLRLRGEGLGGEVADTDPGRVGEAPLDPLPIDGGEADRRTARVLQRFFERARQVLAEVPEARQAKPAVNAVLLRGVGHTPRLPQLPAITRMRPGAIAAYPMYRGVARLIGMECVPIDVSGEGERTEAKMAAYDAHGGDHDFVYFHVKKIDSAGEDGNFAKKVAEIEAFDAIVPRLLAAQPDVVVVTGDHSTPVPLKAHSWHPLPVLIWSGVVARPDGRRFTEADCRGGSLGTLRHLDLLPLAMANAGKLAKYGA